MIFNFFFRPTYTSCICGYICPGVALPTMTKRDILRRPLAIPFSTSRRQMSLRRIQISYGPLHVTYENGNDDDKIFIRPPIRIQYNPIPFQIVRESADTIGSITEIIQHNETIYTRFVLRLFLIVQFFQHAFKNRPTQYRSLRFVVINDLSRQTCAHTTHGNRHRFYYCKERVKIVFNLCEHQRPIDVLSSIVHELAHVFAGMHNGHNNEFLKVLRPW